MVKPDLGPVQPAAWLYAQTESKRADNRSSFLSSFSNKEHARRVLSPNKAMDLRISGLIPFITKDMR